MAGGGKSNQVLMDLDLDNGGEAKKKIKHENRIYKKTF